MKQTSNLPPGITATAIGYRVVVRVPWPGYPQGKLQTKRFTRTPTYEPTVREMERWQDEQRVDARRRVTQKTVAAAVVTPPVGEGFLADADRYLAAVTSMPQYKQRADHMQRWAEVFGERPTASIQPHEIRTQREAWLTVGPRRDKKPGGLGPQEVNLRLRALENFFTVMFPQRQPNPVRQVPECDTPPPIARGQSFAIAREILAHMPDLTTPKKGAVAEVGSLSRVRYEAMMLTGLTPKQLGMLKETDVDWTTPSVTPPRRLKGRAQGRRQRPRKPPAPRRIMPSAVPVLRKLFALRGNQPFSRQSLGRSVRRAIVAANQVRAAAGKPPIDPTLRLYDLTRHTFGTETYRAYRDLKMVQELMGHSDIRQTEIYAKAAVHEHTKAAVAALDALAQQSALVTAAKLPPPRLVKGKGR